MFNSSHLLVNTTVIYIQQGRVSITRSDYFQVNFVFLNNGSSGYPCFEEVFELKMGDSKVMEQINSRKYELKLHNAVV